MKILPYITGSFFLLMPLIIWVVANYFSTLETEVHDIYFGMGDFYLHQISVSICSVVIGIFFIFWGLRTNKVKK